MTSFAAIVRTARAEIAATPADAAAIWERHAADIAAAQPDADASDEEYVSWERAAAALDRLGARCGAI